MREMLSARNLLSEKRKTQRYVADRHRTSCARAHVLLGAAAWHGDVAADDPSACLADPSRIHGGAFGGADQGSGGEGIGARADGVARVQGANARE